MTTKLAIKQKNSLLLKESELLHGGKCMIHKQPKLKNCKHLSSFYWSILGVFLVYWFILCPLIWAICYTSTHWSLYWPFFFWAIAFLIWIMIMSGLMIFWKRLQTKEIFEISTTSKYGSDSMERSIRVHQILSEDAESYEKKKMNDSHDLESKKNDRTSFLKKDLLPLAIHKEMSGGNIEDTGIVQIDKNEKAYLDVTSDYVEKSIVQDYLKLATVSLSDEEEVKSPKTPMSPRELFFIDLIREAEKTKSVNSLKTKMYFFSNEAVDMKNEKDRSDAKDADDTKDEKDVETSELKSKCELNYFIANVENTISEKTEVFLQVDSNVGEQMKSIVEKPMLILQSDEARSQETFISQENELTSDD